VAAEVAEAFMQNLEESVIEFVAFFAGVKPQLIYPHTTLYGDLGVAGR
jgi:hypothetical protein